MNTDISTGAQSRNQLILEVDGFDPSLAMEFVESREVTFFEWLPGPCGTRIRLENPPQQRSADSPHGWLRVIFDLHGVGPSVLLGLAPWLYKKLTSRRGPTGVRRYVKIDRTSVEVTPEGLTRVVKERVEALDKER